MILSLSLAIGLKFLQEPDFQVDWSGASSQIAPGLGIGINDLSNARPQVWSAWALALRPQGGMARIWLDYTKGPLSRQVAAGLNAKKAGLSVLLVVVGDPAHRGKKRDEVFGIPPQSAEVWAKGIAKDCGTLLARGVPLVAVEIWNEPNLAGQWQGTPQSFGAFFAAVAVALRELIPADIALGGPGMGTAAGTGQAWFAAIAEACAEVKFQPDFFSFHFYSSHPSDLRNFRFGERIQERAVAAGLRPPEIWLSEWNVELPHPTAPECDDHRAAVFFAAVNAELAGTPTVQSHFFFLQDAPWDTQKDWAGESVGVFTRNGAPKAVLNGMHLFRRASSLPRLPERRLAASSNLSCLASRAEENGFLLLTNAFGDGPKHIRHWVDAAGVRLGPYRGKESILRSFLEGKKKWSAVKGVSKDRQVWETAAAEFQRDLRERGRAHRSVRVQCQGAMPTVVAAWRVDSEHSDPRLDPNFLEEFDRLRSEDPNSVPMALVLHPSARPASLPPQKGVRRDGDSLVLDLPPWSALLLQLSFPANKPAEALPE